MKNTFFIIAFLLNLIALSIAVSWMFFDWGFESVVTSIGLASSMVITTREVLKKYNIFAKRKNLQLAILGGVGVGKTVFVIVLLDELQRLQNGLIEFVPQGISTIEKVMTQIYHLYSGDWLQATSVDYSYSGLISYKTKPISKQFLLEIRDWCGGDYVNFAQAAVENRVEWLHQSDYFDYVIHSDIVFLMMDIYDFQIIEHREKQIAEMIAAVQILCQYKNQKNSNKIATPVCLLFSQSDLLESYGLTKGEVLERAERLIQVCKLRFRNFTYFFVTSTGKLDENGKPKHLKPESVLEPVFWALDKL